MAPKVVKEGVFDAINHEESIGHDFKALSQAIFPEIDDLCKLPSETNTETGPITTPLHPLIHKKTYFEAQNFLLNACLPLASNTLYPPPFFLTPSCILTPSLGGKSLLFMTRKRSDLTSVGIGNGLLE